MLICPAHQTQLQLTSNVYWLVCVAGAHDVDVNVALYVDDDAASDDSDSDYQPHRCSDYYCCQP